MEGTKMNNMENELNKWVRCEEGLTYSRYTLKGHEDLGLVIATTKFISKQSVNPVS